MLEELPGAVRNLRDDVVVTVGEFFQALRLVLVKVLATGLGVHALLAEPHEGFEALLDGLRDAGLLLVREAAGAQNVDALAKALNEEDQAVCVDLALDGLYQSGADEVPQLGHHLRPLPGRLGVVHCRAEEGGHDAGRRRPDTVVVVEQERGDHDLRHRLHVREERPLELLRVPIEHIAGRRLLLQGGRLDGDGLLADGQELPPLLRLRGGGLRAVHLEVQVEVRAVEQAWHDCLQVRLELLSQAFAEAGPRVQDEVGLRIIVRQVPLRSLQHLDDLLGVVVELLLPHRYTEQAEALHGLAPQHAVLGPARPVQDLLHVGHKEVVVWSELRRYAVRHGRHGRHSLLLRDARHRKEFV
mmetsp:Transcript_20956/g.58943  ORF Transcript_20956/g.58943 Transcript_20956/m.58943 type:complete len:357 (-) Transcript_20956:66-1136(-)